MTTDETREWWKEAVVYQIYPRSFNDSDGDGVGDIPGIIEKVDYLDDLGIDVVWLNPVYESPQADNGYDIADYRAIHPEYGTMDDWERLLAELHDRDIKLIMDLVVNHTSDEHEWFVKSRSDEDTAYDDYYMWEPGDPDGDYPNNWDSGFGGPAWTYDDEREAYYLQLFDEKQPDLNWDNPDVREDVYDMMTWWLEKGIDGFRMDVINLVSKPDDLPDGDPESGWTGIQHFANGPDAHEYISEMNDEVLADRDVMTVGECIAATIDDAREYTVPDGDGLSMIFHFEHMEIDRGTDGRWDIADWDLTDLKAVFTQWQYGLDGDGWNSLYLNNHDQPRMVSRFGDDGEYREESAKLLGTLLHTLRGTPYIYQGEEIGMTNYPFESIDDCEDVGTVNAYQAAKRRGDIESFEEIREGVCHRSRDNARTPMQWRDDDAAGFTEGEPWLQVNPNYEEINVETARADDDSIWHYYRDLITLRDRYEAFVYGSYDLLYPDDEQLWAYTRETDDATLLVTLNFSEDEPSFVLPDEVDYDDAELLISNYGARADGDGEPDADADADGGPDDFDLRPWEARVYWLT